MDATRQLLLVRHGLPDYSMGKSSDLPPGPPLSYVGCEQIRQAIPVVRSCSPLAVYSSPLARARRSAEIIAEALGLDVQIESDLKEWHRTERLYQVNERSARWLHAWLAGGEARAVVFGHASPLLSILRTALYLPHFGWWRGDDPSRLVLNTCDRFEVSMGSVLELEFAPVGVVARRLLHPTPRVVHIVKGRGPMRDFERPTMPVENTEVRRPNFGELIGFAKPVSRSRGRSE